MLPAADVQGGAPQLSQHLLPGPHTPRSIYGRLPRLPRCPGGWWRGWEEALALGARRMEQAEVGVGRSPGASGCLPREPPLVVQRTRKGLGPGPGYQAPPAQPWVWLLVLMQQGGGVCLCWGLPQVWKRLGALGGPLAD